MKPGRPPPGSLEDVLCRIRASSEEAMRELCIDWRHLLEGLAGRLLCHRFEVDDVVQETLLAVWTHRLSYDPARPAWPWLAQILRRRCHDIWRKHRGRRKDEPLAVLPLVEAELVASPAPVPSEEVERDELVRLASACLADLPPTLREVVQLAILEEMSEEDMAALLCVAKGTIKSRKHRGLSLLRAASSSRIKKGAA